MKDPLTIGNKKFSSRFILGSGKFSLDMTAKVMEASGAEIATMAIRRASHDCEGNILDYIPKDVVILPNTSGARNADEAVRLGRLARELGCGDFIKVEVIRDSKYLFPDNHETIKATKILSDEGFVPMVYMMPDLNVAKDLEKSGAGAIMPLGAPIGSNKGLLTKDLIKILVDEIDVAIVVDAGIGSPSQACEAMEIGVDAIMANTAIATANNIVQMAKAFKLAIEAGRYGYLAGLGRVLNQAEPSSPLTGFLK
ncbi:MAG: thiazole synthase [Methanobrevibacter sp.]|jgi:thiazole synthase|nr:thiazole synthase [Candidatus Methanovirga aequatorialis]